MSNAHKSAEAMARIEHKLDLLVRAKAEESPSLLLTSVGDPSHMCPLCSCYVQYQVDLNNNSLTRMCGCSTGIQPPINLQPFAPPTTENGNGPEE